MLLAHGAGAAMDSAFLDTIASGLAARGRALARLAMGPDSGVGRLPGSHGRAMVRSSDWLLDRRAPRVAVAKRGHEPHHQGGCVRECLGGALGYRCLARRLLAPPARRL
ncbi:MAG: hypothetical protein VKJ05_07520 [Synechococcaceae cyanobacterium]|nr:hypothetical protein [Synechococcaceae cyanobacterium]